MDRNKIYCIDNLLGMKKLETESVDLTVTSPPYSDLRNYKGFSWNFEELAFELFRVTKQGGVLVWVIGDKTVKGSEELIPFRQALFFQDSVGFNTWDTMIYKKKHHRFQQMLDIIKILNSCLFFQKEGLKLLIL